MGVMSEMLSREIITVPPEWEMPHLADALAAALAGTGPALAFAPISRSAVADDIAVVIPTSGSTGAAKEVAYTAAALRASAGSAHAFLEAQPGDQWSLLLPINHIAGVNVLVRALALGTDVVDLRSADKYVDVDFTSVVPTQLHRALTSDAHLLAHLRAARAVLVGGAATSDALLSEAKNFGVNVVTTYGMSEMCGGCVYNNQPLPGVDVRISDDGLTLLRGPMMASGYLNCPDLWHDSMVDGWFKTQDIGTLSDGRLTILGRVDDVIISGGEKISLSTIDTELNNAFAPQTFMAFGVTDAEWGTKLCVASETSLNKELIREHLLKRFGSHAQPKGFLQVDELPLRGIGKADRAALIGQYQLNGE